MSLGQILSLNTIFSISGGDFPFQPISFLKRKLSIEENYDKNFTKQPKTGLEFDFALVFNETV